MNIPTDLRKTPTNSLLVALRTALGHPAADELIGLLQGSSGKGAKAGANVTQYESSAGLLHRTRLTFASQTIAVADSGGANGGWGSMKIYDMPDGLIKFLGARVNLTLTAAGTGITTTGTVKLSVGSAAAATSDTVATTTTRANIVAAISQALVALAGTFAGNNLGAQTSLTDSTGGTGNTTLVAIGATNSGDVSGNINNNFADLALAVNNLIATGVADGKAPLLDGTSAAVDVYLNVGVPNASIAADDVVTISGDIDLFWINLGDI